MYCMETSERVCPKCEGTGMVKDKSGIHVCFDCLREGRLDVHSKKLPETKLKFKN